MKFRILFAAVLVSIFSCGKKVVPQKTEAVDEKSVVVKSEPFFKAIGTEPFWNVSISKDEISYTSINETENFTVPYATPITAADANVKLYRSKSDSHAIEVTVMQGKCGDGMSDKSHDYAVKAGIKRVGETDYKYLNGCGSYIIDKRLNTVWTLKELNGKPVTKEDFGQELPYIDLHSDIASFTGFGGCNRIKGKINFSSDNSINFGEVIATKMMCLENNKESVFLRGLQSVTHFTLKDNKLNLMNGSQIVAVLTK